MMKEICFRSYGHFVCEVLDKFDDIRKSSSMDDIAIIAKYDEAKEIIEELLSKQRFDVWSLVLEPPEDNDYYDEYIISIAHTYSKYELYCEPMKRENGYLCNETTVSYILANCSSACLPYCMSKHSYEVNICSEEHNSDELYEPYLDEITQPLKDVEYFEDDDNIRGFTVSKTDGGSYWSASFYTSDELTPKDIQRIMQEIFPQ